MVIIIIIININEDEYKLQWLQKEQWPYNLRTTLWNSNFTSSHSKNSVCLLFGFGYAQKSNTVTALSQNLHIVVGMGMNFTVTGLGFMALP